VDITGFDNQLQNNNKSSSENAHAAEHGSNALSNIKPGVGIGMVMGRDKLNKKDKMQEVYTLFKELDIRMRKQQTEVEELLKNLKDDQQCPYCKRLA